MIDYNIDELEKKLKDKSAIVAIHGAGMSGTQTLYALSKRDIKVNYFIDSDKEKHNKLFCGVKTISTKELNQVSTKAHIFIAHDFILPVVKELKNLNFFQIYDSVDLWENTDFSEGNEYSKIYPDFTPIKLERERKKHKFSSDKAKHMLTKNWSNNFNIKHVDIVITERCSMKCKDCANLMQYYENPQNNDLEILFSSIDRFMKSVDKVYEFRVLGGDPFMNKEMYKVINKLNEYKNVESIVIYTNAKIVPKGENLDCLKKDKVRLQITNYGDLSSKHDEIIKLLASENIAFVTDRVKTWDDIGEIKYEKKSKEVLNKQFLDCCAQDIFTVLDGVLYKCPVSAHGTKLKAVPFDKFKDGIDLVDEKVSIKDLRNKLINFHYNNKYITACMYCKGRSYGFGTIEAAIQTKKPIPYQKITS